MESGVPNENVNKIINIYMELAYLIAYDEVELVECHHSLHIIGTLHACLEAKRNSWGFPRPEIGGVTPDESRFNLTRRH